MATSESNICGTCMSTSAGSLASAVGGKTEKGTGDWVVLGLGLLATVVVTTYVTRLAGKALRQEIDVPGRENNHV